MTHVIIYRAVVHDVVGLLFISRFELVRSSANVGVCVSLLKRMTFDTPSVSDIGL